MGDGLARPVHGDYIRGIELAEIISALFPARVEAVFAAIVEIPYVVDRRAAR